MILIKTNYFMLVLTNLFLYLDYIIVFVILVFIIRYFVKGPSTSATRNMKDKIEPRNL